MNKINIICFILFFCFVKIVDAQLWIEQNTNTTAPITQIEFLDNSIGWALPYYFTVQSAFHILRTTDGGNNWEKIFYTPQEVQFREFQFINSTLGYARGKNKFYKTIDGGYNWSVIHEIYDNGALFDWPSSSMSFINTDIGYISYFYGIYKTTDGGNSWIQIHKDSFSSTRKILFSDINNGWVLRGLPIFLYKTNDGGETWTQIQEGNVTPIHLIDPNSGYIKNGDQILRTSDGGTNWQSIASGYITTYKFKLYEGFINKNSRDSIYHTTNGGETWSSIPTKIVPDFDVKSFAFFDKNVWLGGFTGKIYKMNLLPDIELRSLIYMETLFVGDEVNILWAAHNIPTNDLCKIEYTQNNGITWNTIADSINTVSERYTWKLGKTLVTSTTCRIRITSYGTNASTQNVNFFRIYVMGHIYVAKIPAKPFYSSGSNLLITWNADYITSSKVTLDILITPDTLSIQPSLYDRYENTAYLSEGQQTIYVPYRTLFCKVRVKDSNSPLIYGETNYFKSRQPSQLTFISPYTRHIWPADSIRQVTFSTINIRSVDVSFSPDSGSTWIKTNSLIIPDSLDAHETRFGWKVPRIESDRCMLKFESTDPKSVAPSFSNIFVITQNLNFGVFPLSPNNKWFYKTSGGRYADLGGGGYSYSYPNIYYIIVTGEEKLLNDSKKYYPFDIYRWDSYSNDFKKFIYIGTKYYRKSGNQIFTFGSVGPWLDFEYQFDKKEVFGIERRTFVNGSYGSYWDLIADGLGIIQPFSFSQNVRSGVYQTNNIAGAIIDGIIHGEVLTDFITSIDETNIQLPEKFSLSQNFPNPFNPNTTIKYSIPVETLHATSLQHVTLKVYDIIGREIATLVNEEKPPGNYEVKFDGSNLSSGVYFYRLQTGSYSETKKFLLLK